MVGQPDPLRGGRSRNSSANSAACPGEGAVPEKEKVKLFASLISRSAMGDS